MSDYTDAVLLGSRIQKRAFPRKEGVVESMMLLSDWPVAVKCKTNSLRDNCILLLWLRHIVIVHLLYMIVF